MVSCRGLQFSFTIKDGVSATTPTFNLVRALGIRGFSKNE